MTAIFTKGDLSITFHIGAQAPILPDEVDHKSSLYVDGHELTRAFTILGRQDVDQFRFFEFYGKDNIRTIVGNWV